MGKDFHTRMTSVDEFLTYIESKNKGTIFEGTSELYEKHIEVVEFLVKNQDAFFPYTFIGNSKELIKTLKPL